MGTEADRIIPLPASILPFTVAKGFHATEICDRRKTAKNLSPSKKYTILCLLYTTQTVPIAFMGTALPAIMRMEGISLTHITYLSLVALPTTVKFLWAPLIDRHGKNYFNWVTVFTALYALFFFPAAFLDLDNIPMLAILFTMAMGCMSIQDIAMDTFAIKSLNTKQRAIGNGIQTGGNYLGQLLGGGVLLLFYHRLGWSNSILLLSLLTILPVVTTMVYAGESRKTEPPRKVTLGDLVSFFREKEICNWIPILTLLLIPANIVFSFSSPMLVDKGFTLDEVGYMLGLCGGSATVLSGFLSGIALRSVPVRTKLVTAVISSFIGVVCSLMLETAAVEQYRLALYYCVAMGLSVGTTAMVMNDVSMHYVRQGREGTDYSIQLFLRYLLYTPLILLCGGVADRSGYQIIFLAMLGVVLLIGMLVLRYTYTSGKSLT